MKAGSGAGKSQGAKLIVTVPGNKLGEYEELFKGEGRLNQKATVKAAA